MKSKPFLILQLRPEDETANSEFEAFLKYGELDPTEVKRIRVERTGIPKLNPDDYAGIIVGGSPFDLSTPQDQKSAIQKKLEQDFDNLFDQITAQDFPFIGACSGIGLLGKYCGIGKYYGAIISEKYAEPVGGVDIEVTAAGQKDPLLKDLPTTFRALVGHKEACEVTPPGATLLATSKTCPVQMFRVQNNIYATQFHPEADSEEFVLRIKIYKHHGYFAPEDAESLINAIKKEHTPVPHEIIRRFVARYRPSG